MTTMHALLAAAALLVMAGAAHAEAGIIRGQATPTGTFTPGSGTVLEVELLDVSRADAPSERRGSVSVPVRRLGPIPFVLSYDPAAIEPQNRYVVSARLVQDGRAIMRTDTSTPVLTGDLGTTAELTLVPLAQPEALAETPAAAPVGTWTLADLGGERAAEKVDTYLALTAGEATGRGGCNNFRGSYTLDGEVLRFGPVAATRRLCPPPQMQQETGFFAALEATRGFRIEDGRLILLGEAGAPLASLKRQE